MGNVKCPPLYGDVQVTADAPAVIMVQIRPPILHVQLESWCEEGVHIIYIEILSGCVQQLQRVIRGDYKIPSRVKISEPCRDLLDRILQVNVAKRITIPEILKHKWYVSGPLSIMLCCISL